MLLYVAAVMFPTAWHTIAPSNLQVKECSVEQVQCSVGGTLQYFAPKIPPPQKKLRSNGCTFAHMHQPSICQIAWT